MVAFWPGPLSPTWPAANPRISRAPGRTSPLGVESRRLARRPHTTTSPGGTDPRGGSGPKRVPTTHRSAVPAPAHYRQNGVYIHKQLGGRATPHPWREYSVPPTTSPYTPHLLSVHTCPPPATPTLENSAKPNSQRAQRGPGLITPLHNCHLTSEERPNSDARSPGRLPQRYPGSDTRPRGTRSPLQPSHRPARRPPPPPSPPPHTPPGPASGIQNTCSLKNPSREPTSALPSHQPPRAGFRKAHTNPTPPDRSVPQARLHRAGRNKNVKKERRITAVGRSSCDRSVSAIRLSPSAPSPPRAPARGPRAHQGRRRVAHPARHPAPAGTGVHKHTHTTTRPPPQTQSVAGGSRQREDGSQGPSGSRERGSLPAPGRHPDALPTSADYGQNSCKFHSS